MSISTLFRLASAVAIALTVSAQAAPPKYVAGQVWEYRTRTQDAGSRIKIQQVETVNRRRIYHISIIGVKLARADFSGTLPHLPVSDTSLDVSVTRLSVAPAEFPTTVSEGVAEWRRAKGGVFTIPLEQIVQFVDDQVSAMPNPEPAPH